MGPPNQASVHGTMARLLLEVEYSVRRPGSVTRGRNSWDCNLGDV